MFVEQSSNLKQWSVNILVAGALIATGCGNLYNLEIDGHGSGWRTYSTGEAMPALHKHSISQKKVDRHISWPKSNYLEKFHTLTLYNHHYDLAVLFDEKGIPYYGKVIGRQ